MPETKGRVAGFSLSYPVAQHIAPQDLFGGHYDEGSFTEPISRIPLERLHETTIKTEMNEDSKKNSNNNNGEFLPQRLFNCSCTSDSETYLRAFPNIIGNSYNSPLYSCSVFHRYCDLVYLFVSSITTQQFNKYTTDQ